MPKKILHCLFSLDEEREMRENGFGLDTHGVQHVVIQFERGKRKIHSNATQSLSTIEQPQLLPHRKPRQKTETCRFCKEPLAPQGKWKHEKYCVKKHKGGK